MNNKTRLYLISGALIIGILLLLFGINFVTGQKNTKKPVKPIASSSEVALAEVPTTIVNTNKGISVSKTIKEISSSSTKSISSKSQNSSSSSSESSSSQVSSSSIDTNTELDSRLQWKSDCQAIASSFDTNQKLQITEVGTNKKVIIAPCNFGAYQGQSLVYYYDIEPNGKWTSQRQIFWSNQNTLSLPTLSGTTLTNFNKYRGPGDCGRFESYELDVVSKTFVPTKIQEQDCVPIEQNPLAVRDSTGEIISINKDLWPIIFEKK